MRLVGTVVIMNRLAQAHGHGASSKLGRPCKCVLQVRCRSDGRHILVISTKKDVTAYEYYVQKIQNLRTKCINDGIATIDISEPPMSVMLRDCDVNELKQFIKQLQTICQANTTAPIDKSAAQPRGEEGRVEEAEVAEKSGSLRRSTGSLKRPRSPELSKANKEKVKKCLSSRNTVISVKKRENYPKEFPFSLQQLKVQEVGLKKIDSRILKLKYLTSLDLSKNQITDVQTLTKLQCQLKSLFLASNQIESLPEDFFDFSSLCGLQYLDISNNKLIMIPTSFGNLKHLIQVKINANDLVCLPYNLNGLQSLQYLDASKNWLEFVPATITSMPLGRLDLTGNPAVKYPPLPEKKHDYVGYSASPTLFELACEVVMNDAKQSKQRLPPSEESLLPSIAQTYLRKGKYCMKCMKLSLRYKITTQSVPTRYLCEGKMARCSISPVAECVVKKIMCHQCDFKEILARSLRIRIRIPPIILH